MFHGHLYVTRGSFGEETFIHDGHHYTYFGVFPSILRMPVLLFTHSLDGRLSALSILLSWLITGLFSVLLLWRVRLFVRGPVTLGWAEATSYGVLVATILGGSVLVYLAASPWVYTEDIAWSVALTIGSLFALARRPRVTLMGTSDVHRPRDPCRQPHAGKYWLRMHHRCRAHCGVARIGATWGAEQTVVVADTAGRSGSAGSRFGGQLGEVRHPLWVSAPRSGLLQPVSVTHQRFLFQPPLHTYHRRHLSGAPRPRPSAPTFRSSRSPCTRRRGGRCAALRGRGGHQRPGIDAPLLPPQIWGVVAAFGAGRS